MEPVAQRATVVHDSSQHTRSHEAGSASHQVARMEADQNDGSYTQWLQMAAGRRKCRTAIDEQGIPTLYIPMSRSELDSAEKDDTIFPVWWLVVRGCWWVWTPATSIVITEQGRTYHLDTEEDFADPLADVVRDCTTDPNVQQQAVLLAVRQQFQGVQRPHGRHPPGHRLHRRDQAGVLRAHSGAHMHRCVSCHTCVSPLFLVAQSFSYLFFLCKVIPT